MQTLRNALMSTLLTASTAALGLMETDTLAVPSLPAQFSDGATALAYFTPRLAMEFVLLTLLFASLVSSVMAVRYYNHAGFVGGMPVDSDAGSVGPLQVLPTYAKPACCIAGPFVSWSLRLQL